MHSFKCCYEIIYSLLRQILIVPHSVYK
ncbi:unnamed protein product [Spodoptera exigua]|nr:unnamed protein product [Spodoptera exigua]